MAKIPPVITEFTTDPAVRTGFMQAAWSVAPSFARGCSPQPHPAGRRGGVNATAHYAIGATAWAGISSLVAGIPGHRAGPRALMAGAVVAGAGGFALERALRPRSGDNLVYATAWSGAKLLATTGLAGGLVTASDTIAHSLLGRRPSLTSTLALDMGFRVAMAAGTMIRRNLRAKRYGWVEEDRQAVASVHGAKAYVTIAGISVGTAAGSQAWRSANRRWRAASTSGSTGRLEPIWVRPECGCRTASQGRASRPRDCSPSTRSVSARRARTKSWNPPTRPRRTTPPSRVARRALSTSTQSARRDAGSSSWRSRAADHQRHG